MSQQDEEKGQDGGEEPGRDQRGADDPGQGDEHGHGGDAEPKPGEDPGPMGNPAQGEEALRKQQEDSSE